jgi:predicted transcriptional regulator
MLSRYLGVSLSTARYHLAGLQKDGEIYCRKEGRHLRAYPLWATDERSRMVYAVLQQKAVRRILRAILRKEHGEEPAKTNGWISGEACLSQSTVSEYLGILQDLQLVRRRTNKEGRAVFEIVDEDKSLLSTVLASYDGNLASRATDNYVSLWEF